MSNIIIRRNRDFYIKAVARLDPDAVAFLNAAGITDATITTAINKLVVDLKGFGIWGKMKAIYPFVGGTATTHKFNLKDPRDLDAAFRLSFFGGLTHNSNGVTGNGTNAYFSTNLNNQNELALNDVSLWSYSRSNIARFADALWSVGLTTQAILIHPRTTGNSFATRLHSDTAQEISNSDSRGFFGINRSNSSNYVMQKNTTQTTVTAASTGFQNLPILGLFFSNTFSQRNKCFGAIGESLTSQQATDFYNAVQTFQTTLNRQV